MDFFKDMFPFIKLPTFSDTSFVDAFCGCMTCHPFGTLKRNNSMDHMKPTTEVSTISSIMDKLRAGSQEGRTVENGTSTLQSNCSNTFKIRKSFCGKQCSRKTSFTNDMNHEKFTPVNYSTEFHKRDINANSLTPNHQEYYKIEFRGDSIGNVIKQHDMQNLMVPPPRRKRKNGGRKLSDCTNIEEISVLSLGPEVNQEEWKNSRNMELNDLDQTKFINCDKIQENNINIHDNIKLNNNNNKNNKNNINNNNKKSGCSNIEVVSDSIEPNQIMHSRKLSSVNNINKLTNYDENSMEYCENKVYYKNSGFDKYGNYKHGSDIDEVIVCESIVVSLERARSVETIPDNSTYTKFYTDSLYYDKSDGNTSSSSSDSPFEHIKRLKSENNLILRSPFSRLKAKRSLTRARTQSHRPDAKHTKRTRHESLIKDFYGFLPIHQLSESFSSINPLATLTRKPNKNTASRGKYPTLDRNPGKSNNFGTRNHLKKQNSVGESFDSDYQYSSTDRCDL